MQYQIFPNLAPDEYEALKADIKARGVRVPVEYDEAGAILDGHQFYIPRWSHMVDVGYEVIMSSRYEPTVLDHHPFRIQ